LIAKLIPPGDKERLVKEDTTVVYVMPLAGGEPEPIVVGNVPRFTPDGKKLVYFYYRQGTGRRAAIYDLENKKEHPVFRQGIGPGLHYSIISHDGKYLYINGKDGALVELNAEGTGPAENAKFLSQAFKIGCNMEWSRDMKWLTWVVDTAGDTGGWLMYAPFDPNRAVRPIKMPLGWTANSVNYYPDFSPCGKYYVYAHADPEKGVKSWSLQAKQELYVTRFPKCEATVRVTWNGAANMHPQWWGAPPAAVENEN
jgi:Tol biopolymer transport system component